jgi:hypothetical protein
MLVIKCELWPMGDESKATEICRVYIANDGKTSVQTQGTHGSYSEIVSQIRNIQHAISLLDAALGRPADTQGEEARLIAGGTEALPE